MSDTSIVSREQALGRLADAAGTGGDAGASAAEARAEPAKVTLRFEIFGWLLTAQASLSTMRLPPLTRMAPDALPNLPALDGTTGYYFPSAVLDDGKLPPAPAGYFFVERDRYPRYFLDLDQSFEDFMATKSSKTRSTLRRKLRKFEEASGGAIDWRVYRTPEEMAEFHRLAVALARRTYQARLYDAALPEDEGFRREMLAQAADGRVAGFLLFLAGEPVAYLYAPIVGRRIVYGFLGFDARHAALSPGTVLQLRAMAWCFGRDDLALFDFTEGEGAHKALFSSFSQPCADLILLRNHPRLRLIAAAYTLSRATTAACKAVLDRLGLMTRIRGWMRGA